MAGLSAQEIFSMKDRHIVITGGAGGLGKNIARGFIVNHAASICIVDVLEERLQATKNELESFCNSIDRAACSVQIVLADLSNEDGIRSAVAEIRKTHQVVDSLVACAGIRKLSKETYSLGEPLSKLSQSMSSLDYADMEASFKVNVFAPYYIVAGLIDLLGEAAARGEGRGNVILLSSVAAQHFGQFAPAYQTSKAAIDHMVRIMAAEFAEFYVRVNAISPGLFPSAMNPTDISDPNYNNMKYDKEMPARRAGLEQEIVGSALFLASAAGAYVDGENIRVDGGRLLVMSGKITKM